MRIRSIHLSIALAAAVGALIRSGVGDLIERLWVTTLVVNTAACLLAGIAVRSTADAPMMRRIILVGLLGGLSTFATLAAELRRLIADGDHRPVALITVVTIVGCPIAFTLGRGRTGG